MNAHDHSTIVPGCYRCELGKDEAERCAQENADLVIALREAAGALLDAIEAGDWTTGQRDALRALLAQ